MGLYVNYLSHRQLPHLRVRTSSYCPDWIGQFGDCFVVQRRLAHRWPPLSMVFIWGTGWLGGTLSPCGSVASTRSRNPSGSLVNRLNPQVVIPMHYLVQGLMPISCGLKTPDQWLNTQPNTKKLKSHSLTISSEDLPTTRQVWVFQPSPASFSAPEVEP